MLEVEHCVAVANGTLGLQLLAKAAGLTGQVLMPSFTFIGTAHALAWIGLEPVFCDIDPSTHTLDPASVEAAITPATSAILGVHLWGRPCDVEALSAIAVAHHIPLFFDAAHALGCSHEGRPVGGLGDAEVLSFHATKVANAGEGGVIATDDAELAARMRLMRNFGFAGYDEVLGLGVNAKMSELAAALGLTSLDDFAGFVEVNRRNHARYEAELAGVPGLRVLPYDPAERNNFQYVVLEMEPDLATRLPRDDLVAVLHAENVLARRYFFPGCHHAEHYRSAAWSLPVTDDVAARVVVLPTGTAVSEEDVALVAAVVRVAASHSAAVRDALHA
jgi:dTDP-4-amino-4,6-dideoxygalactose transaminase